MRYVFLCLMLLTTLCANAHLSAEKQSLNAVRHRIKTITVQLHYEHSMRKQYQEKLKHAELEVLSSQNKLSKTRENLKKSQKKLRYLQHRRDRSQKKLKTKQALLGKQIRAAYLLNQAPFLKLLLNQQGAEQVQRLLVYDHYFAKTQTKTIGQLRNTMQALAYYREKAKQKKQILVKLKTKQSQEQAHLQNLKHKRQAVLQQISSDIRKKNNSLRSLLADKAGLENALKTAQRTSLPAQGTEYDDFPHLKGLLTWPTPGRIEPYFGSKIDNSELRWSGILIKAPENQAVKAVANGMVIFADWLPGYGLLLIIDHGHGYMSLYGRNHRLYKAVGDKVVQGSTIATVGKSGGYPRPALYFAIRHNAKPLNPTQWCH